MKKLFTLLFITIFVQLKSQCNYTLITSSYNGFTITCANPTLNLYASTNSTNNVTYVWAGPSFTSNLSTANVTVAGTYTCISTEAITNCTIPAIFSVGINTTVPTSTTTPNTQTVSCNNAVSFTATAITPTTNIEHKWYTPITPFPAGPACYILNGTTATPNFYSGPGVYTHVLTDLTNGCKVNTSMTVTSLNNYPTFSLNSPNNYSVGCSPLNQFTISIINPVSTQTPPATCSFTFLAPGFAGVVTPSIILGGNTSTISTTPGTYTVIVQDNSNWCRTIVPVTITQNTAAPHLLATMPTRTITCFTPTFIAVGSSTTANTIVSWKAFPPLMLDVNPVTVGPPDGPPTSTIALFWVNYTVVATNTINACSTTSFVPISQDFRMPNSLPAIVSTPSAICNGNAVTLNSNNSFVTSAGPGGTVSVISWVGPAPQTTANTTTYTAGTVGVYTLNIRDTYNGCTSSGTVDVIDATPAFGLQGTAPTTSASCNGSLIVTTQIPNGYTLSTTTGTLSGTTITNLCYGYVKVCMTNLASGCKKCDSLLINQATVINEINLEEEIVLYPNPTSSSLFIKNTSGKNATVKIFNVEGREIAALRAPQGPQEIEIKNLSPGIYFVEMKLEGVVLRKKVVVIH